MQLQLVASHVAFVLAVLGLVALAPFIAVIVDVRRRGRTRDGPQCKEGILMAYVGLWAFTALMGASALLFAWAWS